MTLKELNKFKSSLWISISNYYAMSLDRSN